MLKINPDKLFWRKVDERFYICDTETGMTYELEGSAGFIWEKLVLGKAPGEILAELVQTYGIDEATAGADLEVLLTQLRNAGLVG